MSSKHSLWQAKWQIDQLEGIATHDTGLKVRLDKGIGVADNAAETVQVIEPTHGAHNAAAMVQRLVREGEQLLIDPNSRGWRGKDRRA
jgi:hypothetical protein